MADKTVSQLPNAEGINITDLFLLSQGTSALGFDSKKLAASVLAVWLANSMEFPQQLDTTSKTLIGAINELFAGGGGGGGRLDIEYDSTEETFNVTSDEIVEALENGYMITFSSDETADDFLYILNSVHTDSDELNLFFTRFWCMENGSSNPNNGDLFQCIVTVDTANDTVTFDGYSEVPNVLTTRDNATTQFNNWSASKIDTAIKQAIYNVLPTRSANGTIASFADGAENMPIVDGVLGIVATQEGSGDPSPSNVRPISGWTGMSIYRTGANVWDEQWEAGYINTTSGQPMDDNVHIRTKNYIPVAPSTTYYNKGYTLNISQYRRDKSFIGSENIVQGTFTTQADCYFIKFFRTAQNYENDISINYPATDTSYHAYTGTSFPVDWTDEAGTVCGGTLNVKTGLLTVTHSTILDLGSINWTNITGNGTIRTESQTAYKFKGDVVCDSYLPYLGGLYEIPDNTIGVTNSQSNPFIRLKDTTNLGGKTLDEAKAFLSGKKAVIELATPVTYQIDPVILSTLLGANNIWCDTGNSTVKYKADIGLLISGLEA